MNYDSQKEIIAVLKERNLSPTKKFGQNFMISRAAREKVLSYVDIKAGDSVWEIGGGLGAMTSMALEKVGQNGHLTVFEIDRGYIDFLTEQFGSHPGFKIVAGDMVKTWKAVAEEAGRPDVIFGNLPYNSASAMITQLIEGDCMADCMVFTVQKEMGLRITAKPGSADYSSFSVFCQLACDVAYQGDLKSGSFYPVPDVVSGIVTFTPKPGFREYVTPQVLKAIRDMFASRRKTLLNNLRPYGIEKVQTACQQLGIDVSTRAETLTPQQLATLAKSLV
jgi:16S rRNA (adenine1518-N6/adenine1519-N6)-dimethyltransferase